MTKWIHPLAKLKEDGTFETIEREEGKMEEEEEEEEIPLDEVDQQILETAKQLKAMGYSEEDVRRVIGELQVEYEGLRKSERGHPVSCVVFGGILFCLFIQSSFCKCSFVILSRGSNPVL